MIKLVADRGLVVEPKTVVKPEHIIETITPLPLDDLTRMLEIIERGTKSIDEFDDVDRLGRGAFGTVMGYKNYAIKYIRDGARSYDGYGEWGKTDELLDSYILKQLQHIEAIPRLYAVVDNRAIIIERINGDTMSGYSAQMNDITKLDNYISENFIEEHRFAIEQILHSGLIPKDLHSDNVMICRETGKPKIIDVGLFKAMDKSERARFVEKKEKIIIGERGYPYGVGDSFSYASNMTKYVEMKKNPHLLEQRRKEIIERKERERVWEERNKNHNNKRRLEKLAVRDDLIKGDKNHWWESPKDHTGDNLEACIHKQHNNPENKREKENVIMWKQENLRARKLRLEHEEMMRKYKEQEAELRGQRGNVIVDAMHIQPHHINHFVIEHAVAHISPIRGGMVQLGGGVGNFVHVEGFRGKAKPMRFIHRDETPDIDIDVDEQPKKKKMHFAQPLFKKYDEKDYTCKTMVLMKNRTNKNKVILKLDENGHHCVV